MSAELIVPICFAPRAARSIAERPAHFLRDAHASWLVFNQRVGQLRLEHVEDEAHPPTDLALLLNASMASRRYGPTPA